ncbi:hypothetical protein Q5P01_013133 [Channa striata]|uniref:Uncharacterized protein n=1 Tax=Channa striata TaxID=64152 RepID=A0AA88MIU2_CHASR|nr:hypothetical protein Q5P01_013133 [Channa striata]
MRLIVICIHLVVQVLSTAQLAPPQNVHVQGDLLTWTPATEDRDVIYNVQYKVLWQEWNDLPSCIGTALNYCNVSSTKRKNGCVKLRVQAKRHELDSTQVEACSRQGDTCTPEVRLTVRPGSLTVNLSRNHSLALHHGGHAQHRVYYGKEGKPLEDSGCTTSSMSFHNLEQGQRYCVKIEYILYFEAVGPESCIQCVVIPDSEHRSNVTAAIAGVVAVLVLIALIILIAYILIFHKKRIKQLLQPPLEIPAHILSTGSGHHLLSSSSPAESFDIPDVVEVTVN